tara:strand:- start:1195 stop:2244 length:1050 start_codon:yes stop_codon:yes gene_type:complete
MKLLKKITLILIVFFQTGNLLSKNNLFNVNNILLEKQDNTSNIEIANLAVKVAFKQLIKKVLLKEDMNRFSDLKLEDMKDLVVYYNISKNLEEENNKINLSITFDKDKIHDLFFKRGILYSDISEKELYILPILLDKNEIFIFANNYFYENWNTSKKKDELIDFILLLENIETIKNVNQFKNNLIDLELKLLFKEYSNKNIALALIENSGSNENKVYLRARIQNKILTKNLKLRNNNLDKTKFNEEIIFAIKEEITNLIKSQNLIDIRTPSFLNVRLILDNKKKSNLVLLNSKIGNIESVENIYVQQFNKNYVELKIKYLGKLDKIMEQLKNENINLQFVNDQWLIKIM